MKTSISIIILTIVVMIPIFANAQNKVVVVPLGGVVGTAAASDVVKGKTFSSKTAGKGVAGTLNVPGRTSYTNSNGITFSYIPAGSGSFFIGSPDTELGHDAGENLHVVTLTQSFYMQTTEVTQGQWERVMGSNPSYFKACGPDCPVEKVSWYDAVYFANKLSSDESMIACYDLSNCTGTPGMDYTCTSVNQVAGCTGYFLPTESQWEYAARAGTVTAFHNGDITDLGCNDPNLDLIGWYCGNANTTTHPVAWKASNNWGLYDVSGNVWEWVADWYGAYPAGPVTDPAGPGTGSARVVRGGSYFDGAWRSRSAYRSGFPHGGRSTDLGFRLSLPAGN